MKSKEYELFIQLFFSDTSNTAKIDVVCKRLNSESGERDWTKKIRKTKNSMTMK